MKHAFLPEEGTFYKANLHCHSILSDGKLTPRQLKEAYQERGYSILAITDHEALFSHEDLNDGNFLTINGVERSVDSEVLPGQSYDYVHTCHLNFLAKNPKNTVFVGYNPDYANQGMNWVRDGKLKEQLKFDKPLRVPHLNFLAKNPKNTVFVGYNPDYANQGMNWVRDGKLKEQLKFDKPLRVPYSAEGINAIIALANENGFLVTVNHLCWSKEQYEQFSQYKGMFAMEIYNHGCYVEGHDEQNGAFYDMLLNKGNRIFCLATDDNHNRYPFDDPQNDSFGGFVMIKAEQNGAFYDMLLNKGNRIFCLATDDNHNRYPFDDPQNDSFGGFVMIKARELTYEAVIAALEQGAFYASTGPVIQALYMENGKICIDVEGAKRISLTTDNRHAQVKLAKEGESLTHAEFDTERINQYFRIEVTDAEGKRAYTNAYFRDTWA